MKKIEQIMQQNKEPQKSKDTVKQENKKHENMFSSFLKLCGMLAVGSSVILLCWHFKNLLTYNKWLT